MYADVKLITVSIEDQTYWHERDAHVKSICGLWIY